jgi:hypothetical protein
MVHTKTAGIILACFALGFAGYVFANSHSSNHTLTSSQGFYTAYSAAYYPSSITISAWIKPASDPTSGIYSVVDNWYNDNSVTGLRSYLFGFYVSGANNRHVLWISTNGSNNVGCYFDQAWSGTIRTGDWVHVAATYNSSDGVCKIYIDGTEKTTTKFTAGSGAINNNGHEFFIGLTEEEGSYVHRFDGLIDDVRVYNTVLTDFSDFDKEECSPPASMVGYWKLNNSLEAEVGGDLTNINSTPFSTDIPFVTGCGAAAPTGEEYLMLFQ